MKKQGRKNKKAMSSVSKKAASNRKKLAKRAKTNTRKVKGKKKKNLFSNAKKKMNAIKKQSSKTLKHARNKAHTTEEEIVNYVKDNPIKSVGTAALVGLITGFVSRFKR